MAVAYDFAILSEALAANYGQGRKERHAARALIGVPEESVVAWANPGRHQTVRFQRHGGIAPRTTLTLSDDLIHAPDPGKL